MNTSEDEVIARFRQAAGSGARTGQLRLAIGDDAAIFSPKPGHETMLTCDWFLEGTHFLRNLHPPDAVGWKCLARALSDIAAMGGEPKCFLLSIALPSTHIGEWLTRFLRGLRRASREFGCPLAGGDTTRRREIVSNVTAIGEVRKGQALLRSGARPGDDIFVSGRLGEAELGLKLLRRRGGRRGEDQSALRKHLFPEPRLALGQWLARRGLASALMDLSDGLSSDLPRLCRASHVGAQIEAAKIPAVRITSDARRVNRANFDPLNLALNGGDDYELLFTVPPGKVRFIPKSFDGISLTRIGEIGSGHGITLIKDNGREEKLTGQGWDPFRS